MGFSLEAIPDEVFARMLGRSYGKDCTVRREALSYLRLEHVDAEGIVRAGEMVTASEIAEDVLEIFEALLDAGYPIERVRLIDDYDADDERSMAANNCSSFNYRLIAGTDRLSNHAYGLAVDINPAYNPYVSSLGVFPPGSQVYLDPAVSHPYKIEEGDTCYRLFMAHGFTWGGHWEGSKDYQHFEKARSRG